MHLQAEKIAILDFGIIWISLKNVLTKLKSDGVISMASTILLNERACYHLIWLNTKNVKEHDNLWYIFSIITL